MEFAYGAATVAGIWVILKFVDILSYPSVERIEMLAMKPLPAMGDNSKITIWGLGKATDVPERIDQSPFVVRVGTGGKRCADAPAPGVRVGSGGKGCADALARGDFTFFKLLALL